MEKIKYFAIKTIFLFSVLYFIFFSISAQNIEIIGDTCEFSINGYQGGTIQWQFSNNNSNWIDINGANEQVLSYRISETGQFRAKVTDGKCLFYSEPSAIEALNFDNTDENGKSRVSKKSEFIILIPDIQNYISNDGNDVYLEKIIDWILKFNNAGFKVKAVLQVGDVTNFNSRPEWEKAQKIFSKFDNKIDFITTTGNHDYGDDGTCNNRNTYFSEYFNFSNNPTGVTTFQKNKFENTYLRINIHNKPFQIFTLEFGPRDKVVLWADSIAKANPNVSGMLMTHAYLFKDKQRFNFQDKSLKQKNSPEDYKNLFPKFGIGNVNDGEEIWNKLVFPNSSLKFVFCGHQTGDYVGNLISKNKANTEVLQLMFNTQAFPNGGDGWIQIMEFFDDKKTVGLKTYSAFYNTWKTDLYHQYEFHYSN
ncbi:MAG TPA: metallophosphoesterase [Draconibacterium sp.]|nr:metallophosphoesterase [Draconibacterium sp.]